MSNRVDPFQLQVGMYVMLEEHWLRHPFLFNNFLIENESVLQKIQKLNLDGVKWSKEKSLKSPLSAEEALRHKGIYQDKLDKEDWEKKRKEEQEIAEQLRLKQERIAKAKMLNDARVKAEKMYEDVSKETGKALENILTDPESARETIDEIANEVAKMLNDEEAALHLLNSGKLGNESLAHAQAMGVMMVSALIATSLGLDEEQVIKVTAGGLLHDVGREKVGEPIWRKPEARRITAEKNKFKMHVEWGAQQIEKLEIFSKEVIQAIRYHHERMDGSGYPKGLMGTDIPMSARIVGLAEHYYQLCHPYDGSVGIQPFQALAKIFKDDSRRFDIEVISGLVRGLGVYPPGTLVELSNGQYGLVCMHKRGVKEATLKPMIEVFDAKLSKKEKILINLLEETEVSIRKALTPDQLPQDALNFLMPKFKTLYFNGPST